MVNIWFRRIGKRQSQCVGRNILRFFEFGDMIITVL